MRGRRRDTLLALWNLSLRIPEAQRFSRIYRWRKELIDHIFVSHALVGKIAQDHVTTDAADAAGPTPPSMTTRPTPRRARIRSPSGARIDRRITRVPVIRAGYMPGAAPVRWGPTLG